MSCNERPQHVMASDDAHDLLLGPLDDGQLVHFMEKHESGSLKWQRIMSMSRNIHKRP